MSTAAPASVAAGIVSLYDPIEPLASVGGKAHNLMRLAAAGLPVPAGFVITTSAYREWIAAGRTLSHALTNQIQSAYDALGESCSVAVRSSGTAEDLARASCAGGHETILNVRGIDALLPAIRLCWESLDASRVHAYRARMGVVEEHPAIAVVVQRMVRARASGVIFTAEPVAGDPQILAVDACTGLGDALVSGRVTPDHYELRRADLAVLKPGPRAGAVSKSELRALARSALAIEAEYRAPQDIEWSIDLDGRLHILQSRPITTAPDWTQWTTPIPGAIWVRYGSGGLVEYLPGAVSPLFATAQLPRILRLLDAQCPEMGVITPPPSGAVINGHFYSRQDYRLGPRALLLPFAYWNAGRKGAPRWKNEVLPVQTTALACLQTFDLEHAADRDLLAHLNRVLDFNAAAWDNAVRASRSWEVLEPVFQRVFSWFIKPVTGGDAIAFLRGFSSQTLCAERAQFDLVEAANAAPAVRAILLANPPADALEQLETTAEGRAWATRLLAYCSRFGHAAPTLDYLEPAGEPAQVIAAIRARLDLPSADPLARHERMVRERVDAQHDALRKLHRSPLRRAIFRTFLGWVQEAASIREDVFFHALSAWPLARRTILALGNRLEQRGRIAQARDIFFLEWDEIAALAMGSRQDYAGRVATRLALFDRQKKLTPPLAIPAGGPPLTLARRLKNIVKRFVMGSRRGAGRDLLHGAPVSPGRVTGPARILASPADLARLQPGDILVLRAATPEWTAAFALAAALVTDTGGPLSHSSIIAREFGLAAVMGVGCATTRIAEGRIITVDGAAGAIRLHPPCTHPSGSIS